MVLKKSSDSMEKYVSYLSKELQAPCPNTASRKKEMLNILGVGIFISIFLYYFFGDTFESQGYSALLLSLQFGVLTIIGAIMYEGFVSKVLKLNTREDSWTFAHWMIYMIGLLIVLANINYGLFLFHTQFEMELAGFLEMTQHTLAVGILPIIFSGYTSKLKASKLHKPELPALSPQQVSLFAKNHKQELHLYAQDILYLEALENYVYVYFVEEGEIQKVLLRNTLKSMSHQLRDTSTLRCHRSFMVNTAKIKKIKGNAQGLKLELAGIASKEIPVSRTYIPMIKAMT